MIPPIAPILPPANLNIVSFAGNHPQTLSLVTDRVKAGIIGPTQPGKSGDYRPYTFVYKAGHAHDSLTSGLKWNFLLVETERW
jgi:hypothetical protein